MGMGGANRCVGSVVSVYLWCFGVCGVEGASFTGGINLDANTDVEYWRH